MKFYNRKAFKSPIDGGFRISYIIHVKKITCIEKESSHEEDCDPYDEAQLC